MKVNRIKKLPTTTLGTAVLAAAAGSLLWWRWAAAEPSLSARTRSRLADRVS